MNAGIGMVTEDRKQEGLLFNLAIRENLTLNVLDAHHAGFLLDRGAASAGSPRRPPRS